MRWSKPKCEEDHTWAPRLPHHSPSIGLGDMQETGARTILSEFLAVAISLAFSTPGFGQASLDSWPDDSFLENSTKRQWPDGPNKEFLKNLMRPDNHKFLYRDRHSLSCCDAGDTVKTKFKVEGDGKHPEDRWYAWLDDDWVIVPPDKIVPDYAPDGQAYLFMLAGTIQCFVRPKGGL
jgi:hypothetical protein